MDILEATTVTGSCPPKARTAQDGGALADHVAAAAGGGAGGVGGGGHGRHGAHDDGAATHQVN